MGEPRGDRGRFTRDPQRSTTLACAERSGKGRERDSVEGLLVLGLKTPRLRNSRYSRTPLCRREDDSDDRESPVLFGQKLKLDRKDETPTETRVEISKIHIEER